MTTVLGKVHFTVNLYSLSLPLVPQGNPSFPNVSNFLSYQAEQLSKTPPSFSVNPFFLRISQLTGQNQQNGKPLSFKISFKDTTFHIFINSLELDLSLECLLNLSLQIVIYHPILNNNCNNVFTPVCVMLRYSDTRGVVLKEEQP